MVIASTERPPLGQSAFRGPVVFIGTGAVVLALGAGILAFYVDYLVEAEPVVPVSVVVAGAAIAALSFLARVVGRRQGDAGRAAVWLSASGGGAFLGAGAHAALSSALVVAPGASLGRGDAALLGVPVAALVGLAVSAFAGWRVGRAPARAATALPGLAAALTAVGALLVVASTIRSTRPDPDRYLQALPVEGVVPVAGDNPIERDPARAQEVHVGPLWIARGSLCDLEIRTEPPAHPPSHVTARCDRGFQIRHDPRQRLWIFEGPVVDLSRRPSAEDLPPGQKPKYPYIPRDAVDDEGVLRELSPIDVGGSLAPPWPWVLAAAAGCAGALVLLLRGRRKRRRLLQAASGEPAMHEGEGRIVLEDGTVLNHPEAARLPSGPVVALAPGVRGDYRETPRADQVEEGTREQIRAHADASFVQAAACALAVVVLTCSALGAATLDGLVFGNATLGPAPREE